jgi:20S proteasome alpha/beta subunit
MTLAIAWKSTDGAILGADTEFTGGGYSKYKGKKILGFPELGSQPFFAFAGVVDYSMMCIDELVKGIRKEEKKAAPDVPAAIRRELVRMHREYGPLYPDGPLTLQLLIVLRRPGAKLALFRVCGPVMAPIPENGVECIGVGETVSRLVIDRFYREGMTSPQADRAVMYTLFKAKEFVGGVGKDSEIVFFREGEAKFGCLPVEGETITMFQETLSTFDEAARDILLNYNTVEEDSGVFTQRLKVFSETLIKARAEQIEEWKRRNVRIDLPHFKVTGRR